MSGKDLQAARKLYGGTETDSELLAPGELRPGETVELASRPGQPFAIIDRHGALFELESTEGKRLKAGWRALRRPQGRCDGSS